MPTGQLISQKPHGNQKYNWNDIARAYLSGMDKKTCLEKYKVPSKAWARAVRDGRIELRNEDRSVQNMDLTNKVYGRWTVIKEVDAISGDWGRKWLCRCNCGTERILKTVAVRFWGKSCGCLRKREGNRCPSWKGYGEISSRYWKSIISGSKRRGRPLPFSITIKDVWELFLNQNRKCVISGADIRFGKPSEQTASLDRIDSSRGYERDNVQWVHKDVNFMKMDLTQTKFLSWVRTIHSYQAKNERLR